MPSKSTHIQTTTRRKGVRLTAEQRKAAQEVFLQSFTLNGNVLLASKKAGVDRSSIYDWLEKDPSFSVLYHQAERDFQDVILGAIIQRAIHGYEKPLVSWGKLVYDEDGKPVTEKVYSDNLLALLAKSKIPEFREKQPVESMQIDNINVLQIDTRSLNNDQLAMLKTLAIGMKGDQQ